MKGNAIPFVGLAVFIAACWVAQPVKAEELCNRVSPWPGGNQAEVIFTAVDAYPPGQRGDGPNDPMPLSLTGDVLSMGRAFGSLQAGGLVVEGAAICVRYRPEWIGLQIQNNGAALAKATLELRLPDGYVYEARLPDLPAGQKQLVLLRSGAPLATLDSGAFTLKVDG
jgi:hypothetical protein